MDPIPPEALPIVETLRRDVPRPAAKPTTNGRWTTKKGFCCPMGLHPLSMRSIRTPYDAGGFGVPGHTTRQVQAFADWWDARQQTAHRQQALDAVWPPTKDE